MKRVLVTGASGFIGRHCLPALRARGYEVHAVTRSIPAQNCDSVFWHAADLLDGQTIPALLAQVQPRQLLHLAWYAEPGKYWTASENFSWVSASLNLLLEFRKQGGQRAVLAGTCAEYGRSDDPCRETDTPLEPTSEYGICKNALRMLAETYARHSGLSLSWGRIFYLFGTGEHPSRLVSSVIRSLLRGEEALCSPGTQVRDFLEVGEVGSAFAALLDSPVTGPVNIASGQPISVADLVRIIGHQLSASERLRLGARPPSAEPPLVLADVTRLSKEVGWNPQLTLEQGISRAIDWWRQNDRTLRRD